ncbi:LytR/AlgR family response regulator transcription factor [Lewinella sp. LCG006]|uniref:LytR/AlgR family response regulator transcription factor n=1 Tax=Lewinella sp. LCG006 TaxID=3231911 RepID=UPI003461558B
MNNETQPSSAYIFIRKQNILHRIHYDEIRYIQAEGNYCYFITSKGGKYTSKISLKQLVLSLPDDQFVRIHKSYVLNFYHLLKIDTKERLAYVGEAALPVGRTFLNQLTDRVLII